MAYTPIVTRAIEGSWWAGDHDGTNHKIPNNQNPGTNDATYLQTAGFTDPVKSTTMQLTTTSVATAVYTATDIDNIRVQDMSTGSIKSAVNFPANMDGAVGWTVLLAMTHATAIGAFTILGVDSGATQPGTFSLRIAHQNNITVTTGANTLSIPSSGGAISSTNVYCLYVIKFDPNTKVLSIEVDGKQRQVVTLASNLTLTGIRMGCPPGSAQGTRTADMYITVCNIYKAVLSNSEIRREAVNIRDKTSGGIAKVVWHGNSHLFGTGTSSPSTLSARALTKTWLGAAPQSKTKVIHYEDTSSGRPTRNMISSYFCLPSSVSQINKLGIVQWLVRTIVVFTEETNEIFYLLTQDHLTDDTASGASSIVNAWIKYLSKLAYDNYYYDAGADGIIKLTTFNRYANDATQYRPAVNTYTTTYGGTTLRALDPPRTYYYSQIPVGEYDGGTAATKLTDFTNSTTFNADLTHLNDTGSAVEAGAAGLEKAVMEAIFPALPGVLSAPTTTTNTTALVIAWTNGTTDYYGNALTMQLQIGRGGTGWTNVGDGGGTTSPENITSGLLAGQKYDLRVLYTSPDDTANPVSSNILTFTTTGSPADNSAPTVTSAVLDTDGQTVIFTLDKAVSGENGFRIFAGGVELVANYTIFKHRPTTTTIKYLLPWTYLSSTTFTYQYSVTGTGNVKDCTSNQNVLAAIGSTSITNNSTVTVHHIDMQNATGVTATVGGTITGVNLHILTYPANVTTDAIPTQGLNAVASNNGGTLTTGAPNSIGFSPISYITHEGCIAVDTVITATNQIDNSKTDTENVRVYMAPKRVPIRPTPKSRLLTTLTIGGRSWR